MSISVGSASLNSVAGTYLSQTSKTSNLEETIKNSAGTSDEDLMQACKSFESYLLEQVFKGMKSTIMKDDEEEENDYLAQFGDMLYEEYAEEATEKQSLGIAQMLYDSMKRNV